MFDGLSYEAYVNLIYFYFNIKKKYHPENFLKLNYVFYLLSRLALDLSSQLTHIDITFI
jgi:hypothetical protein